MKKLAFLFFLVATTQCLFAQNQQPFQYNSKKTAQLLKKNNRYFTTSDSSLINTKAVDTARYIGKIKNAKLYALPQDRMRCLRPDSLYAGQIPVVTNKRNGLIIKQKGNLPTPIYIQPSYNTVQQMPNAYKGNAIAFE